jgi:hypothetical protein
MPKVMIEVDIPDGWKIPQSEDVKRLVDPDWMASWWHIDDIIEQHDRGFCGEITQEEAREVLRLADKYHDCEVGICWDVIDGWIDHVKAQRKEVA